MHSTEPHVFNQESGVFDAVYLSPHLDDAVLSLGNELYARGKSHKILVVTFFTQGNNAAQSQDVLSFLKQSGGFRADRLFAARRKEDIRALKTLGVPWYRHCGLIDGLFRTHQSGNGRETPLYPSFSNLFGGRVHPADDTTCRDVTDILAQIKHKHLSAQGSVFAPLGVGAHADHLIIHEAAARVFGTQVNFWEDVPYRASGESTVNRLSSLPNRTHLGCLTVPFTPDSANTKRRAIGKYKSQLSGLVSAGLGTIDYFHEAYYEHKH